jgi:hypothetical protein
MSSQDSKIQSRPKIVRYKVVVANAGGTQKVLYSTIEGRHLPEYNANYHSFNGSFKQFVQFSDAVAVYADSAFNLNVSPSTFKQIVFLRYPNSSQTATPYTLNDGTVDQMCSLKLSSRTGSGGFHGLPELWPLSVFEQRLSAPFWNEHDPKFDSELAKELLVNTTISVLLSKECLSFPDGTLSRSFNMYHFENKLIFILPYGLSLGLAIPIIVMGLYGNSIWRIASR